MKTTIIQFRDSNSSIISADIIEGMMTEREYENKEVHNLGYASIILFITGKERRLSYSIQSEIESKYYEEDVERVRFALNKVGGNL